MKIALTEKSWEQNVVEWIGQNTEYSGFQYGIVAFGRSPDGKYVDCISVVFQMDHITHYKESISNNFPPASDTEALEHIFGEMSEMKVRNFLRFKAIEGCYNEGLIDKIGFVNTLEDEKDEVKRISTEDSASLIPDNTLEKNPISTEDWSDPALVIHGNTNEEKPI